METWRKAGSVGVAALISGWLTWTPLVWAEPEACQSVPTGLQVLGSGGPELDDQRASSGYLVWHHGKARVLIDLGPGSLLRYDQSGARLENLDVILLTHLHVDHSADLPGLLKGAYFTERAVDLPLYGPTGNDRFPATRDFVKGLFGDQPGVYRYLGDYLTGGENFRLIPHDVSAEGHKPATVLDDSRFRITAIPVHHGPVPALAWRVDVAGQSVVISGDMNGDWHTLETLAGGADLLVADHAIPEGATGVARQLHMPPSVIGRIAATAKVKHLVLSHRMNRSLGREAESERAIRQHYRGPLAFADDGQCYPF